VSSAAVAGGSSLKQDAWSASPSLRELRQAPYPLVWEADRRRVCSATPPGRVSSGGGGGGRS
jgi:hypothetical protein